MPAIVKISEDFYSDMVPDRSHRESVNLTDIDGGANRKNKHRQFNPKQTGHLNHEIMPVLSLILRMACGIYS
ncbi:MAG: hypothetical protein GYA43_01355 [Bacteroidales bacterium]|jgi:hypothetical protein|nr:hypothetical protein [Bacteroidales bacterium]